MWGFRSIAAVTQRLSRTFWHRQCFTTPPPLSTLPCTAHSPSTPRGQPEEAMEASTESWDACPGCHSSPQLLWETCCDLWCQAPNNETLTVWSPGRPRPGNMEVGEAAGSLDTCHAHFFTSPPLVSTPRPSTALGNLCRPLPTELFHNTQISHPKIVPNTSP